MAVSTKRPVGQQVLVVFGASSGIGRATALEAAHRGAAVLAAGRDRQALESLLEDAAGRPGTVVVSRADAADAEQVAAVATEAVERFGRLDTWAHVAGVSAVGPFRALPAAEFERVVAVDLFGPVNGARAALPHLAASGGTFVVVSSIAARRTLPLHTAYSAAKGGVDAFVQALRVELRHDGTPVDVVQILPGSTATPFFERARARMPFRPSAPPPFSAPESVARAILAAAERPRREVVVGVPAKALLLGQRLSPRLMDRLAQRSFRLLRSSDPASTTPPDGLFDPPAGEDRVRGAVDTLHH